MSCLGARYRCEDEVASPCASDGGEAIDCAETGRLCDEVLGCRECTPGEASCADGQATWCSPEGKLLSFECDDVQGLTCDPEGCSGPCSLDQIHHSYIGCDYYPTVTLNPVWSGFPFAIAVSNASDEPTEVTITRGDELVGEVTVPAGALQTLELDWIAELKGGDVECATPPARGASRLVPDGAYRVRSTRPVTVYQFSPLEYELDPRPAACPVLSECSPSTESRCLSYTNDASLLLPASALTGSYTALAWPTQLDGSGFLAITATEDGTVVHVSGHGSFEPGGAIDEAGRGTITLDRGDVVELVAAAGSDLSGTRVRADKPVQVIGGHSCAYVPDTGVLNCDHVEESMLPEDTLGSDYLVTSPVYADGQSDVPMIVRIAAIAADTEVSFDPPIRAPAPLDAGEFLDVALGAGATQHVRITGTKPVLVASYMQGQEAVVSGGSVGDPSMSLAIATEQFRTDYLFTAPTSYAINIANVIVRSGSSVRLDGVPIDPSKFTPIGESGYAVAREVLDGQSSVHTLEGDEEFGLTVYGYGLYTSYMYPGGADLERITIPEIF
jgi:hypothetical protein